MNILPFNANQVSDDYRKLYGQTGNCAISIFTGEKHQMGYGLGFISGNILKATLSVLKQGVKSLGKTA